MWVSKYDGWEAYLPRPAGIAVCRTREVPEPWCFGSRGVSAEDVVLLREDAFGRQGKGPIKLRRHQKAKELGLPANRPMPQPAHLLVMGSWRSGNRGLKRWADHKLGRRRGRGDFQGERGSSVPEHGCIWGSHCPEKSDCCLSLLPHLRSPV